MKWHRSLQRVIRSLGLAATLGTAAGAGAADPATGPEALLLELDGYPHARQVATSREAVVDYEIGLGAMQKHLGDWHFKKSERVSGERLRFSWQIVDGFSSTEVFKGLMQRVAQLPGAELLFACEGRACGNGAQWANQVFSQRVLYGRAEDQRYSVYRVHGDGDYLVLAYAAARTSDRQYLHAEVVSLAPQLQQ